MKRKMYINVLELKKKKINKIKLKPLYQTGNPDLVQVHHHDTRQNIFVQIIL